MIELSVLILGLVLGSVPVITYIIIRELKANLAVYKSLKQEMENSLKSLNELHLSVHEAHSALVARVNKLENEYVAQNFVKGAKF